MIALVLFHFDGLALLREPRAIPSEIYLGLAAVFIFGACFFAAKQSRLPVKARQMLFIGLLAIVTVCLIWVLIGMWNKKPEPREKIPIYSPETAVSSTFGLLAVTSTGAASIEIISNCAGPWSRPSGTVSPTLWPSNAWPMAVW